MEEDIIKKSIKCLANAKLNETTYEVARNVTLEYLEQLEKENKELNKKRQDGTLSDGYHTYNDLYYQRCVLFATICNINKNISWKSKRHSDGKKCFDNDNWFIVGIDTPKGSYTYHYEMKYWDIFEVQELERAKEWDGHTEKDVTRLLSLDNTVPKSKIEDKIKELQEEYEEYRGSQEWEIMDSYEEQIDLLKELLEE